MKCVWFGGDNTAPSTSAAQYNFLVPCFTSSWNGTESQRQMPISEDITITKIQVIADTAPGTSKSYTYTIRDDGSDTSASVVLSDAETDDTWTGSVSVLANSVVSLKATPSGTPAAPTNVYWIIEYETGGQYFLMFGGSGQTAATGATNYSSPIGGNSTALATAATDLETLIPSGGTITKLTALLDGTAGASKSYDVSLRLNNSSDNLTVNIAGASEVIDTATGSVSVSAGDGIVIKIVPTGTPTARRVSYCMTVAPTTNGECFFGFGSAAAPSTTATNYEQLIGLGNNGWNTSATVRNLRPPAYDFKKLYVKLATAPGGSTSRTFNLADGATDTALSVTITGASTTGNNTGTTVTHTGADGKFRSTVSGGTPAASAGVHIGYVIAVPQGATSVGITKALQYTVKTTPSAKTKSLQYALPTAKASTLSDNFNDNSLAAKWNKTNSADPAQVLEQNSRIEITHSTGAQYNSLESTDYYDLVASNFYVKLTDVGNQALVSHSAIVGLQKDTNNKLYFDVNQGNLYAWKIVAGVQTQIGSSITYSGSTHLYLRLREASGTVYFDTSPDTVTWTNRWNLANPFTLSLIQPFLQTGCYATEASGSRAYFDDFNIAPATSVGITKQLIYTVKTTPVAKTKSLKYTTKTTPSALTKALKYTVRSTATSLTKSLRYAIKKTYGPTKSLKYTVKSPVAITKALKYTISKPVTALTKTARYAIRKTYSATKGLDYVIAGSPIITKSLRYAIRKATTITKSARYAVKSAPTALTKALRYTIIRTPAAATKALTYRVRRSLSTTKSLRYTVKGPLAITKQARYAVRKSINVTKNLTYDVKKSYALTKSLKYTIKKSQTALTKQARYAVATVRLISRTLSYEVKTSAALTKPFAYRVRTAETISLPLVYRVLGVSRPTEAITLDMADGATSLESQNVSDIML